MEKDKEVEPLIKEFLIKIAGKPAEGLADLLFKKKNVSEFKIAEKLDITIHQVRNLLYRVSEYNILDSTRKKDKKKGWYIYFWTLNLRRSLEVFGRMKRREINLLGQVLKSRQVKIFYYCANDKIEMSEETAMHHGFLCPECGELLQPVSEEKKIKELKERIEKARREMAITDARLAVIVQKQMKKMLKKVKRVRKKKVTKKEKEAKPKKKGKEGKKKIGKAKPKKKVKKKVKKAKEKVKVKKVKPRVKKKSKKSKKVKKAKKKEKRR